MGGSGSGRPRSRACLSDIIRLDVREFVPYVGKEANVTVSWSNGASIAYISHAGKPSATLFYKSRLHDEQDWREVRQDLLLAALPCHFGGRRYLFHCPRCKWRRTRRLYSIFGQFMCRTCTRLPYRSQGMSAETRLVRAIQRLQEKLDPEDTDGDFSPDYVPRRPRWMRRHTYRRLAERLDRLQQARDDIWNVRLLTFARRWGALPDDLLN